MYITKQLFTEKQLDNLAASLVWGMKTARTGRYRRGDIVLVITDLAALDLAQKINARLIKDGLNPVVKINHPHAMDYDYYKLADASQLKFVPPGTKELYDNLNGLIMLRAPESITHLKDIDPKKIGARELAMRFTTVARFSRQARGLLGWTLTYLPTAATAKEAGLTLKAFTDQIVKACFLDEKDPIAKWTGIAKRQNEYMKSLNKITRQTAYFRLESKNADLKIVPGEKRQWLGGRGCNIPSFELFLSPDWRGTAGVFYANLPSYRNGNLVKGVRLEFKNGSAVAVKAAAGEKFVQKQLALDTGANKVGEFSLTDTRFSNIDKFMANTLFDENFGGKHGNSHIAVGSAYADSYDGDVSKLTKAQKRRLGFNDSALHWDLVNTEPKRVTAYLKNGQTRIIYEKGKFSLS
ncbi:MAG: aminopeptidase [Candidatus Falkowbacteria bacterium]